MRRFIAFILIFFATTAGFGLDLAAPQPTDLASAVSKAEQSGNLEEAVALLPQMQDRVQADPSDANRLLLGRLCLAIAEMHRYQYEKATDMDPRDKRLLGRKGDDFARIGHDAVDPLPDNLSEKWRIKADLYMTMIRSLYKGNKFVDEMEEAKDQALKLGPDNPNALLTAAKRPLFAEAEHGGDVPAALALIDKALTINPNLERAHAFRGVAYEKMGKLDDAVVEWKRAIELNPNSGLAKDKLEEHKVALK
jgi:tetratricopeptide (TPR) repeat protein